MKTHLNYKKVEEAASSWLMEAEDQKLRETRLVCFKENIYEIEKKITHINDE